MLNQLNRQVLHQLNIKDQKHRLIDLGCGMGGTMRYALNSYPKLTAYGVTLPNYQVKHGNKLLKDKNAIILKEDYNQTSFKENTFNSAIAIESFCHSGHSFQSVNEAYRILKPNGKLVIADAFLKKEPQQLGFSAKLSYEKLCNHFDLKQLETIKGMEEKLSSVGFKNVSVKNISWRVAPSVFHVPIAITGFILKNLIQLKPIKPQSRHNLKGSFYALLSGLHLNSFGYYLIKATK